MLLRGSVRLRIRPYGTPGSPRTCLVMTSSSPCHTFATMASAWRR